MNSSACKVRREQSNINRTLQIERLRDTDIEQAKQFALASRLLLFPEVYQSAIPADIVHFQRLYLEHDLGCFIVAKSADRIIGSVAYRAYDGHFRLPMSQHLSTVEVVKLFVDPDYRRQGIANALCQCLFEHAQAVQIEQLYLHTHPFLPAAEYFWQKHGFQQIKREWIAQYDTIHMQRLLSACSAT